MAAARLSIGDVNAMSREEFGDAFGGVFEHSPWVAERAWEARPWPDLPALHAAMVAAVDAASPEERLALIRSHPDLVGRAALSGTLTRESTSEQRAAGLDPGALSPETVARFAAANSAYQERFGFPFVICARENTRDAILAGFATRLGNTQEQEIATAIGEIGKIAWYRLSDLIDG